MKLEGDYLFEAAVQEVWDALFDTEVLAAALPGCEKLDLVDDALVGEMTIKIGPISGKFTGKVQFENKQEPSSYTMLIDGRGTQGFVKATATIKLAPEGNHTKLRYEADAQIGGKIATVGQRLVDASARAVTKQSLENLHGNVKIRAAAHREAKAAVPPAAGAEAKAEAAEPRPAGPELRPELKPEPARPEAAKADAPAPAEAKPESNPEAKSDDKPVDAEAAKLVHAAATEVGAEDKAEQAAAAAVKAASTAPAAEAAPAPKTEARPEAKAEAATPSEKPAARTAEPATAVVPSPTYKRADAGEMAKVVAKEVTKTLAPVILIVVLLAAIVAWWLLR